MLSGGCGVGVVCTLASNDVIILATYGGFIWPYMEDLFDHIWRI